MPLLYDSVALGMWAYTRTAFRVHELGTELARLEPGTILVSSHRRETDVPLVCATFYFHGGLWRDRSRRLSFSARHDMFLTGFFAGFPNGLPLWVRKALYPLGVGDLLHRNLQVFPIRSATRITVAEVVRERPEQPLEAMLPTHAVDAFRARAAELGVATPGRGSDVLRGEYADLLWRALSPDDVTGAGAEALWGRRAAEAAADFRHLAELVRKGGVLLVFPEGRPSPDGEIGPLRRGLAALVRKGRPARLQVLALAYDPLTRGRTRAYVSLAAPVEPQAGDVEAKVLSLLRRATPLTCGQLVAHRLLAGENAALGSLEAALAEAVEDARAEGRPLEPELASADGRRRRLAEALAAARGRDEELAYLAREYRSARLS